MASRSRVKSVIFSIILAFLLGVIGLVVGGDEKGTLLFVILFPIGFIVFLILLLRVNRVAFWFSIIISFEWLLLPLAVWLGTTEQRGSGCAGFGAAIGLGIVLSILLPIGIAGFLVFLGLAFLVFRK